MSSSPAAQSPNTQAQPAPTPGTPSPGNGNTGGNTPVPAPDLSVGTLTLTPAANPFVCLAVKEVALGANVTVATCDQSPSQRWLWQDMRLKLSDTLCLSFAASGTAALKTVPVLATCSAQDYSQVVMRGSSAGLAMHSNAANFGLSVTTPTASNSQVTFENLDPSLPGQKWILGSDSAATGTLVTGGIRVAGQGGTVQCLTVSAADQSISYAPCTLANASAQSFRWNEFGALVHKEMCLTGANTGPVTLAACAANDKNQTWYSTTGFLQLASGGGCLSPTQATVGPCPPEGTPQMILGLPPQK